MKKGKKTCKTQTPKKDKGTKRANHNRARIFKGQAHAFMAGAHFYGLARIFVARARICSGKF